VAPAQNGWLCDTTLTMLFALDMPTLWNLRGDESADIILIPPCYYPPLLHAAYGVSDDNRAVQFFRNKCALCPTHPRTVSHPHPRKAPSAPLSHLRTGRSATSQLRSFWHPSSSSQCATAATGS